jgi:hypothetical protein
MVRTNDSNVMRSTAPDGDFLNPTWWREDREDLAICTDLVRFLAISPLQGSFT